MEKTYLLIKRFSRKLRHDDLSTYASSIAFFLFLSLIPLLVLICFLIPYTPFSEADLMLVCMNLVPKQMNPWIIGLISQVYDKPKGILPVTFFITIWSAGKGMLALMRGLNRINDVMEERGYFRLRLLSSIYTIVILIVLIITFVLGVFGRNILKWLVEKTVGVMEIRSELISLISFLVMISVSIFAFSGIYTYIPNKKLFFYKQIPGAVFVASAWSIFTGGLEAIGRRESMYQKKKGGWMPDDFSHEQSLVFDSAEGLVIFNSCSHGGVINIINEVRAVFPDKKIVAFIGGFHIYNKSESEVRKLAENIRETGIKYVCTGHCTGEKAYQILKEELGDVMHQLKVGKKIEID